MLHLCNTWFEGGHKFVRWSPQSSSLLRNGKHQLSAQLRKYLSRRCAHVKGHGGVKASVRYTQRLCNHYGYVARFDIRSYYQSMDHQILETLLNGCQVTPFIANLVQEYLSLPDPNNRGKGMVAGGALSPLLGALYLTPLDREMERLKALIGIRYQRFMDDFVIFAPTRHKLRRAIRCAHVILDKLRVRVHPKKRFIGKTQRGFDFLGYWFEPHTLLKPSRVSLSRFLERARRLQEKGADLRVLRQYVQRWVIWHRSGLCGMIDKRSHFSQFWNYITRTLNLN